ncbi:MAG: hypothetical protein R2882_05130 [Gemmatimonadales bacterium]
MRRGLELVSEIVIVLVADEPPERVLKAIALPGVEEYGGHDGRRATIRFAGGDGCQIVVTPSANLGAVLIQATGSQGHLEALTERARAAGLAFRGAALWRGSEFIATPDEAAVYQALGLEYLPPELREGDDEVARAAAPLPPLVTRADLRGLLHCHTSYSDGSFSVRDLARICGEAGSLRRRHRP